MLDGSLWTAYLLQVVESIGWRLDHAGWVWAEKGYAGVGGVGILNSGIIANYLFTRPGKASALPAAAEVAASSDVPARAD